LGYDRDGEVCHCREGCPREGGERESIAQAVGNGVVKDGIPAFAGMTESWGGGVSQMTPTPGMPFSTYLRVGCGSINRGSGLGVRGSGKTQTSRRESLIKRRS
jgi:hypothetical protein